MTLTPEERNDLFSSLSSLIPQKFGQLLFTLSIPNGIVPPPPAPQDDRVFQLLAWAETPEGCGLVEVQRFLWIVMGQTASSHTSNPKSFRPFLEIPDNGSMRIWDIVTESWCELPINATFVTSDVSNRISQDLQYAQSWKKVHSLTESLYPQYVKLHRYMLLCQKLSELRCLKDSEKYRFDAATFFEPLRLQSMSFSNDLKELVMINQVELVSLLCYVPICSPAISQSLGSGPESSVFRNGVLLTERISELLLDGLHVADRLLEEYFANAVAS
ncbi:MAG: hypothetical protein F6K00_01195 [Leptolyngbya sp. SIOISBB]|nr:hypothetical protein [Leptolyngbya sp. SIOISBB]